MRGRVGAEDREAEEGPTATRALQIILRILFFALRE